MSRAGARASRQGRAARLAGAAIDGWQARIEAVARVDAVESACSGCGLVSVSPGPPCVVCGSPAATFVRVLAGHHVGA